MKVNQLIQATRLNAFPILVLALLPLASMASASPVQQFPANGATQVNPDVQLKLTFQSPPAIGTSGMIRVYDAADNSLVDSLDMSIPPSPRPDGRMARADTSTRAPSPPSGAGPDNPDFQFTRIAGSYFHFFPIIVRENTATLYLHNNKLEYGRKYIVKIDPEVLVTGDDSFEGFASDTEWTFTTKAEPPSQDKTRLIVAADGSGDFNTVQGAIDFVPDNPSQYITIFIRNGHYEEIVFMNNKSKLILRGEDRDKTVVGYANNSAFNRIRPAFSVRSNDIQLSTFTINNYFIGQAEALLMRGDRNIIDRMTLNGSGDAMTTGGSIYMVDSKLTGDGDTILAYASLYCLRSEIHSVGPFVWPRTPAGQHGNIFVDCTFVYTDQPLPWTVSDRNPQGSKTKGVLARLPRNGPAGATYANFPNAEMVLINCKTDGIPPEGWGPIEDQPAFDWTDVHLWEYNTMDLEGKPIDLSNRHAAVRILNQPDDEQTIKNYSDPEFVLGGWKPVVR